MYKVYLKPNKEESLKRFHPWVFSGAIAHFDGEPEEGEVVEIYTSKKEFIAKGHFQIGSIAVRVLTFRQEEEINADFWKRKLSIAYDMRRKAKTANFGIIYGISVFGLAERMGVSRQEAKELIDGYFETYPQVKEYMDKSIQVARENGYVETIFHRKRFLPDINSRNGVVRGYAERNAINAPIQGSAADIIKVAMAHIYQRFQAYNLKAKMILQVHDELNFSVPEAEKELVQKIVIEEMEQAYRMYVPLKADCGWGNNWLQAH